MKAEFLKHASARFGILKRDFRIFRILKRDFRILKILRRDFRILRRDFRILTRDFRILRGDFRILEKMSHLQPDSYRCVAVQNFFACGGQDQRRQISARHVDVHRVHIYVACI